MTAESAPEDPTASPGRRWLRVVPGAALVLVAAFEAVRTWDALLANHPAYPLALLVALVVGVVLVVGGLRPRLPARPGRVRTAARALGSLGGLGVAALMVWAAPAVADPVAIEALEGGPGVTVTDSRGDTLYEPTGETRSGLVLIPGARVDPRAYAVLAGRIAAEGHRVVVVKCPFDLEIFCPNAPAAYIDSSVPWSVGGHSLGGVVASSYAGSHDEVAGLVLWASYPVQDLSGRDGLATVSISAENDGLATPDKVEARDALLPPDTTRVQIPGAIHSFFGDYGLQAGDGTPTTSRAQAQDEIVGATVALLDRVAAGS